MLSLGPGFIELRLRSNFIVSPFQLVLKGSAASRIKAIDASRKVIVGVVCEAVF